MIEVRALEASLRRARARVETEPPFSPDWDAAMAEIEALEQRIPELEVRLPSRPAPPAAALSS